jgi:hypothetical protein
VRGNKDRWQAWLPAACAPGWAPDASLTICAPCPAGSYCRGGNNRAAPCPFAAYCPAGSSGPVACPPGMATAGAGAGVALQDCATCLAGYAKVLGSGCVPTAVLAPAAACAGVFCLLVAAGVMAAVARRRARRAERAWRLLPSELDVERSMVLGLGSAATVMRGHYRGTEVRAGPRPSVQSRPQDPGAMRICIDPLANRGSTRDLAAACPCGFVSWRGSAASRRGAALFSVRVSQASPRSPH